MKSINLKTMLLSAVVSCFFFLGVGAFVQMGAQMAEQASPYRVGYTVVSQQARAGATSDYLENALLGHVFKGTAYTGPSTTYIGLSTSACSDSGFGTEVSGGSYARVAVTSSGSNWTGPTGGNGTIANTNAITFPAPTANWGSVTHWFIADASTAGNPLVCSPLTVNKTVNNADAAPSFSAGSLTFQIDN